MILIITGGRLCTHEPHSRIRCSAAHAGSDPSLPGEFLAPFGPPWSSSSSSLSPLLWTVCQHNACWLPVCAEGEPAEKEGIPRSRAARNTNTSVENQEIEE